MNEENTNENLNEEATQTVADTAGGDTLTGQVATVPAETPLDADGEEAENPVEADGDGGDEEEFRTPRDPFKSFTDRFGTTWVRLYCEGKKVIVNAEQISALTHGEGVGEPLIHLANAKDVLRVDFDGWCALNTWLFNEFRD